MFGKKKVKKEEIPSQQIPIEELRSFIKLGLERGYTLREMANALKGSNIDTNPFKRIAQEEMMKNMDYRAQAKQKELQKEDKYVRKLKSLMMKLQGKG